MLTQHVNPAKGQKGGCTVEGCACTLNRAGQGIPGRVCAPYGPRGLQYYNPALEAPSMWPLDDPKPECDNPA